ANAVFHLYFGCGSAAVGVGFHAADGTGLRPQTPDRVVAHRRCMSIGIRSGRQPSQRVVDEGCGGAVLSVDSFGVLGRGEATLVVALYGGAYGVVLGGHLIDTVVDDGYKPAAG